MNLLATAAFSLILCCFPLLHAASNGDLQNSAVAQAPAIADRKLITEKSVLDKKDPVGLTTGPNATVLKDGKPFRGVGINY